MPELPEVETVRRGLDPAMTGRVFVRVTLNRPNLRFPFSERFVERITGKRLISLSRRAKFLIADLSSGDSLIMHLGMSGRFIIEAPDGIRQPGEFRQEMGRHLAHDHVVFDMEDGTCVIYNDVRRFGFMLLTPTADLPAHPQVAGLGVEPLGNDFNAGALDRLFAGKATPLKAALLDQRLIAGLGNIYVCEALNRSGLSPFRAAGSISGPARAKAVQCEALAKAIRDVLTEAVEAGGSTLRDYAQTDGSLGYFQHRFRVYGREGEPCPTPGCRGHVGRDVQSGRSTFWCARCQS